jgi:hypothetical protein
LGEITTAELRDDQGTKRLLKRAVTNRLVGPGDRLNVFAAAEHALRVGTRNPAGLFVWLIVNRRWDFVTQGDEDEARRRLLRMERSPTRLPPGRVGELLEAMRFSTCTPPDQANLSGIDAVLQQCLAA